MQCPPSTPVIDAKRILKLPSLSSESEKNAKLGRKRLLYIIREDCTCTTKIERLAYKDICVKVNQKLRSLKDDLKAGIVSHKGLES